MWEKSRTTKCDKRTVICDVELHNVMMESSNVRKKRIREPPNVAKELLHVMMELHNMRMEPSNVRKK